MSAELQHFIAAAPQPLRAGLRAMSALARRPRGMRLLSTIPPVAQLALGLVAMERFEEPAASAALGWDADAVASRGLELRRAEGRP